MSLTHLVTLEFIARFSIGLVLLLFPLTTIKVLGLPRAEQAFWPRLLGGLLIGLALASFIETTPRLGRGLGPSGSLALNVSAAFTLTALLVLGSGIATRRGKAILWIFTFALYLLAVIEIAFV